jgi:hypothetical protein
MGCGTPQLDRSKVLKLIDQIDRPTDRLSACLTECRILGFTIVCGKGITFQ